MALALLCGVIFSRCHFHCCHRCHCSSFCLPWTSSCRKSSLSYTQIPFLLFSSQSSFGKTYWRHEMHDFLSLSSQSSFGKPSWCHEMHGDHWLGHGQMGDHDHWFCFGICKSREFWTWCGLGGDWWLWVWPWYWAWVLAMLWSG